MPIGQTLGVSSRQNLTFGTELGNDRKVPDQDFFATGGRGRYQDWGSEPPMTNLGAFQMFIFG